MYEFSACIRIDPGRYDQGTRPGLWRYPSPIYAGQGLFILQNPETRNILLGMVQSHSALLHIPFLLVTICATIIAAQAIISQEVQLKEGITTGLDLLDVHAGYMAVVDIEKIIKEHGVREKIIFYGIEEIHTNNPIWRVFSLLKKVTPNFVQFNKLPAGRLHGVATRVEM